MASRRNSRFIVALVAATVWPAWAQEGIAPPKADWLWPQVQARITVQTAALSPLGMSSLARGAEPVQRGVQGGAVFGDYVLAHPAWGSFRATSGLLLGSTAGAPVLSSMLGSHLGLTLLDGGASAPGATESTAHPYLGVGYDSPPLWGALSVRADIGLAAARPAGIAGVGRALFGTQATDLALRELRLSPMLQLGVRLAF